MFPQSNINVHQSYQIDEDTNRKAQRLMEQRRRNRNRKHKRERNHNRNSKRNRDRRATAPFVLTLPPLLRR